jgi:hypothetical protein
MKNLEFGKALSLLHDFMHIYKWDKTEGVPLSEDFTSIYKDANELLHKNHTALSEYLEYMYNEIPISANHNKKELIL